jgi:hypothetical protein
MRSQYAPEKALSRLAIPAGLQIYINDLTVPIHRPPQAVLLAVDLYENFIDVECVAVATMSPLQSSTI